MGLTIYRDLPQGTEEWFAARCGLLTASEMKFILTPKTLKACSNDKERTHLYELLAQRITRYVEPSYIGDDMLRGYEDEARVREAYSERYAPVEEVGFITNDKWGFTLGYSPDGLVGEDGQIEAKSRRQKYQIQTIIEYAETGGIPEEYLLQAQTGLLVSERQWCDFVSYSGGLHAPVIRVYPDPVIRGEILTAAAGFEERIAAKLKTYQDALTSDRLRLFPTERVVEEEMVI